MNIPDEAVEAALHAMDKPGSVAWVVPMSIMRLALAAALPHLDAHIHCAIDAADAHARIKELEEENDRLRAQVRRLAPDLVAELTADDDRHPQEKP